MERDGPGRARAVLDRLPDKTTPLARYLLAIGEALSGRSSSAVDAFSALLTEHPQCVHIQRQLLVTLENLGDNARRCTALLPARRCPVCKAARTGSTRPRTCLDGTRKC